MAINILLVTGIIIVLCLLTVSFIKRPYAYINILLTGIFIFFLALLTGNALTPLKDSLSQVYFLWESTRILFIPVCLLSLFVCISNVSLLLHEGFRKNNFLGFLFFSGYLIIMNILWFRINAFPEVLTPLLIFIRFMVCYGECTILAICVMGFAVLRIAPAYDKDFVIILGCSVSRKGMLRPLIKDRTNRAIRFVWEQEWNAKKTALYVPSGGQGPDEPLSEGSAMALYLLSHGAEDNEVFPEKRSRNTRENLIYSKEIIDGMKEHAKTAVVTNNFHVLRSGMLSYRAGLDAELIGCKTIWYFWPNAFFREMIAILLMNMRFHTAAALILGIFSFILSNRIPFGS